MATERLTTGHPARIRYQHPGHVRMLIGDAYIAIRFLRETPRRIAGLPTDASFLTTLFAIGVLATALRRIAAPALRVFRPRHPSFAGTMIAGAVVREAPGAAAGAPARDIPFAGPMIAISLAAPAVRLVASTLGLIAVPVRSVWAALAAFGKGYGRTS